MQEKKQLKETDALEYLNLVKLQFCDSPEIYNRYADVC
jgi:histone deacetylase complex regulatory component SIN3